VHISLTLLAHVLADTTTDTKKGNSFAPFLVLLALFAVAYFVFLRPARNRQRAAMVERRSASVGDEVTTTAGLVATVVAIDDDYVTLEIAPGVHCRYLPAAILRVNGDEEDEPDEESSGPDLATHEVIEVPPTSVDEPTVIPNDSTDGTTEKPGP
jgi:preprotein translocase subunit YajC